MTQRRRRTETEGRAHTKAKASRIKASSLPNTKALSSEGERERVSSCHESHRKGTRRQFTSFPSPLPSSLPSCLPHISAHLRSCLATNPRKGQELAQNGSVWKRARSAWDSPSIGSVSVSSAKEDSIFIRPISTRSEASTR